MISVPPNATGSAATSDVLTPWPTLCHSVVIFGRSTWPKTHICRWVGGDGPRGRCPRANLPIPGGSSAPGRWCPRLRGKKWTFPIDFWFHGISLGFGWKSEFHLAAWPLPGSLLKHTRVSGKGARSDTMILTGAPLAPQGGVHQVLLETKALWGGGVGLWICCFTIQNHSALIYCLPCLDTRCRPRTSVKMDGKQKRRSFCLVIAGGMVWDGFLHTYCSTCLVFFTLIR